MPEQLQFSSILASTGSDEKLSGRGINSEMVVLAREAKGYSQKELARALGCHQSRLSKLEAGELSATDHDIGKLSTILNHDRSFFFQHESMDQATVSFYRKARSLPLKMLRQCNAQVGIRRLWIERRIGTSKLGRRDLPYLPVHIHGGASAAARRLRAEWNIPPGPIKSLISLMEDAGCIIIDHEFPSPKLDGVSFPNPHPVVFLNQQLCRSRRRISLAHELGHLVMHRNPHEQVEEEAWQFAAEFLAPQSQIDSVLEDPSLDKLGQLKVKWGISIQALLRRAKDLGKISESYHRFLWVQIGKCGYRVHEPFEETVPEERPTELEKRLQPTNLT